jgi:Putative DNA-binding domain
MIFDWKKTSDITISEIEALVTDHASEDQFLDFKAQPYPAGDVGTPELVKDVSAFANAAGGYLIIGIGEAGPGRANGFVHVENAESVRRSMIDRCFVRIEPRLPELDIRVFSVNGKDLIICRVPDSPLKPHLALPDREHHSFWKRYVDGNKLMTHAEVVEAIHGDAVNRELAAIRQELARHRTRETANDEMAREVDEHGLLELESPQAFAQHTHRFFLEHVGDRPYFRLTATPLPLKCYDLRTHRQALEPLLTNPPKYPEHGWHVGTDQHGPPLRQAASGLQFGPTDFHHLRLFWNGHLEFWTPTDDESFTWGMDEDLPVAQRSFHELAIIGLTASFVRLANAVWTTAGITGDAEFQLFLHRVRGRRLPPFAANSIRRQFGIQAMSQNPTIGTFQVDEVKVGPRREQIANLPGTVPFHLVSEVYFRLGYGREHIPYFNEQDRYVYDFRLDAGRAGGSA